MNARLVLAFPLLAAGAAMAQSPASAARPVMPAVCSTCHKPAANTIRGYFESTAWKTGALQVNLGTATEIVRFDPKTVRVLDAGTEKPAERLVSFEDVDRLVAMGPAKGGYTLVDSRPLPRFQEGSIPGALLVPEEEVLARLAEIPADKRIVTHCSTAVRAEMADHKLREKGYKVAFLHADVDVGKDGRFEVSVERDAT